MDYAWEHGKKFFKGDKPYVMCNYCSHVVQGVTRLKYHLANVKGIVKVCDEVPQSVKKGFRDNFTEDPRNPNVLILKENQNRVPPQDRHGDDVRLRLLVSVG